MPPRKLLPGTVWLDPWGARCIISDEPQYGVEKWTKYHGFVVANGVRYRSSGSAPESEILLEWTPEVQLALFTGHNRIPGDPVPRVDSSEEDIEW